VIIWIVPPNFESVAPAQKMRDFRNLSDFFQRLRSLLDFAFAFISLSSNFIFPEPI